MNKLPELIKTGNIVKRDSVNTHLPPGTEWLEVYPRLRFDEVDFIGSLPMEAKLGSRHPLSHHVKLVAHKNPVRVQSPLLVRLDIWNMAQVGLL